MNHNLKFSAFTVVFGFVPYVVICWLGYLADPSLPFFRPSPEVLFAGIATTAAACGELMDSSHSGDHRNTWLVWWQVLLFAGVATSCILYGGYVHHQISNPSMLDGLDCAVVTGWAENPATMPEEPFSAEHVKTWGGDCREWMTMQRKLFHWSNRMVLFWILASMTAVALYPPRRRSLR